MNYQCRDQRETEEKFGWQLKINASGGNLAKDPHSRDSRYPLFVRVSVQFSSVTQSSLTLCDPHGLQHTMLPCPSPTPRAYSNSCPSSGWCHPSILSSVAPFSFCPQSFPASRSFPMSWLFASGDQSIMLMVRDLYDFWWVIWISTFVLIFSK